MVPTVAPLPPLCTVPLICLPPINSPFKLLFVGNVGKGVLLLCISRGKSSAPRRNSQTPKTSLQTEYLPHLQSFASLAGISRRLKDSLLEIIGNRLIQGIVPSLVMKLINSLTHSCIHSFASLAIFALSGSAVFIIRATGNNRSVLVSFHGKAWCMVQLPTGYRLKKERKKKREILNAYGRMLVEQTVCNREPPILLLDLEVKARRLL